MWSPSLSSSYPSAVAQTTDSVPKWISVIVSWHEKGLITSDELQQSLEYLDKEKIIDLGSNHFKNNVLQKESSKYEIQVTKGEKHLVPLDKIRGGGPPPDGIPSIDEPKFVSAAEEDFVADDDLVIGVNYMGEIKAYPLFIMTWHEIVNDFFGDVPVAVTYCPLCFTNQVFERTVDGKIVEFGTSGKLYNSNLVMYDRLTGSYWSQALGLAIKGELTGTELEKIPFDVMTWSDWKTLYPETLILTTDTGNARPYGTDPYSDYFKDPRVLFPVENEDDRLPKKDIILGFESDGIYKAYRLSDVESKKIVNDKVGSKDIVIISTIPNMARIFDRNIDGRILEFEMNNNDDGKIIDVQTGSIWDVEGTAISGELKGLQLDRLAYDPGFWFEWVAFHPDTLVYE
ncbi:MAG: DUF3179 domain-containing protein [Nitrosopumilus sp.]